MDFRRLRYIVAIACLIMTVALVTYKLAINSNPISDTTNNNTQQQDQQVQDTIQPQELDIKAPTTWTDITTTLPSQDSGYHIVYQTSNSFLLINGRDLIPLSTSVYDGTWTGVIQLSHNPLIVYYRYEIANSKGRTYLYDARDNSSRSLDRLTMLGKLGQVYLFAIQEPDGYRGLSALINHQLQTLYTGTYQTAQYLGDVIRLNHEQTIYLSHYLGS